MKKITLVLFIAAFLCCAIHTKAQGTQWILFGESENQSKYFYDRASVTDTLNGTILVWTKVVFSEPDKEEMLRRMRARRQAMTGYENLSYDMDLFELNCRTRVNRYVSTTTYDRYGKILYTYEFSGTQQEWEPIMADGLKESLLKKACKTVRKQPQ
jgi:hypothetical protein